MSRPLKVVAVTGNTQRPSRTATLVEHLLAELAEVRSITTHLIELGPLLPALATAVDRRQLPDAIEADLRQIETADLLVVASPVYRGSYTGLFKHLFDLVHHEALIGVPVLLAATGGSDRHSLVIDHQLRPLFSFFQALTLPIGVYGAQQEFDGYALASTALQARIALAVAQAAPLLQPRAATPLPAGRQSLPTGSVAPVAAVTAVTPVAATTGQGARGPAQGQPAVRAA